MTKQGSTRLCNVKGAACGTNLVAWVLEATPGLVYMHDRNEHRFHLRICVLQWVSRGLRRPTVQIFWHVEDAGPFEPRVGHVHEWAVLAEVHLRCVDGGFILAVHIEGMVLLGGLATTDPIA